MCDAASAGEDKEIIDINIFAEMLRNGLNGLKEIVQAQVGDKTLVDTLEPSVESLEASAKAGENFTEALSKMKETAEAGTEWDRKFYWSIWRRAHCGNGIRNRSNTCSVWVYSK